MGPNFNISPYNVIRYILYLLFDNKQPNHANTQKAPFYVYVFWILGERNPPFHGTPNLLSEWLRLTGKCFWPFISAFNSRNFTKLSASICQRLSSLKPKAAMYLINVNKRNSFTVTSFSGELTA